MNKYLTLLLLMFSLYAAAQTPVHNGYALLRTYGGRTLDSNQCGLWVDSNVFFRALAGADTSKVVKVNSAGMLYLGAGGSGGGGGDVTSVNGQTGIVLLLTSNIPEGGNLYYTTNRVRGDTISYLATQYGQDTTDLNIRTWAVAHFLTSETDPVYTASVAFNITAADTTHYNFAWLHVPVSAAYSGGTLTVTNNNGSTFTATGFLQPGFFSATSPLTYSSSTGIIAMPQSGAAANGWLGSVDWNTFNNKQAALGYTAENAANKATGFGTVNNTLYPSVQAVVNYVTGLGYITGNQTITLSGDVTGSGTTSIPNTLTTVNATPGTFGSSTNVAQIAVDAKGRVTGVSNVVINYSWSNLTSIPSTTLTGDVTATFTPGTSGATTLKNTGTAGTYGSSTLIPVVTTDAQGRVTAVTTTTFTSGGGGGLYTIPANSVVANTTTANATPASSLPYTTAGLASALLELDANSNAFVNNCVTTYTSVVTSATVYTVTAASPGIIEFTGSTAQTITMPVVATLTKGFTYVFRNTSNQDISINTSAGVGTSIISSVHGTNALANGQEVWLRCVNPAGGTASNAWEYMLVPISHGVNGWAVSTGGTGGNTWTTHGVLIGEGTVALVATAAGNANTVLTGNGSSADPTFQSIVAAMLPADVAYLDVQQAWTKGQAGTPVTLTDAATVAIDLSTGNNFLLTLTGNHNLGVPTNVKAGQTGSIDVWQDATGSRTFFSSPAWCYSFAGGVAPALTTAISSMDMIGYKVNYFNTASVTCTGSGTAVFTWSSNGLIKGQKIQLTGSAAPGTLSLSTTYWVTPLTSSTFNISASLTLCQAGTYLTSTTTGTSLTATAIGISLWLGADFR